jgi:uncharacterized protein YdaU (DUF1376 family)
MPQSWSKDEEKQLLKEIKEGKNFDDLAKVHNRSISALIMRFNKIIYENIEGGKSKGSLAKLLNITVDKVNQSYYEHKAFLEKKGIENEVKTKDTESQKSTKSNKSASSASTKSTKSTKTQNDGDKLKKINERLNILEKENKLLKELIENMKLKKKLGDKLNNNDLLKEVLQIIKSNRNR